MSTHPKEERRTDMSIRNIRRSCKRELVRTFKRMKTYVPEDKMKQCEQLYMKQVAQHITYIVDHASNRKVLADWWEEHVCPDIARICEVEPASLARAFRDAFGG